MGVELYPPILFQLEADHDEQPVGGGEIDECCNEIEEACKGWGTNEERLLKALGSQKPGQRCKVPIRYKQLFDKELKEVMESECGSRDFGTSLQFLSVSPVEAECMMIEKAVSGVGTDEKVLATIVCGRTNKDLELLKKKYFDLYTKDLGQVVASELGGNLEKLIINVMQADEEEYDPDYHNQEKMEEDAVKLYKMGQGEIGSDEVGLFKIMVKSPPQYLHKLNMFYADKYGYTLPKVLEKELGGQLEFCAEFMLNMKLKPFEAIAELVNDACEGFGTHELLLTTIVIRYQPIMKKVNQAYQELYGKSIEERVQSETGGDYRAILKEVVATSLSM